MEQVERVAEAVLYEGYLLYPYTRSAIKNQQRWTFGGVYPREYSEATGENDPWRMQTQCLVRGGRDAKVEVKVRFLQVVERRVAEGVAGQAPLEPGAASRFVDELRVGERVYRPWEEAVERAIVMEPVQPGDLVDRHRRLEIDIPEGEEEEQLVAPDGTPAGALVRAWRPLQGEVEILAQPLTGDLAGGGYQVTVRIVNTTSLAAQAGGREIPRRDAVLRQTFVSTHTILRARCGDFVSLLEPPDEYQEAAERCENIKTWPVLVEDGQTMLSSPIILYDYPQVAPESPGDLFDATEIDELLRFSIMTLTDEEKREMRESDPRGREILERTESLSPQDLMNLHGAIRGLAQRERS